MIRTAAYVLAIVGANLLLITQYDPDGNPFDEILFYGGISVILTFVLVLHIAQRAKREGTRNAIQMMIRSGPSIDAILADCETRRAQAAHPRSAGD
jgi:hypothetical protein